MQIKGEIVYLITQRSSDVILELQALIKGLKNERYRTDERTK